MKTRCIRQAAGGIGKATALRLGKEGACVMLADIDDNAMAEAKTDLGALIGKDQVATVKCDVRDEHSVAAALQAAAFAFGGVDIVVANAGIASAAPLDETDMEMWNRNISILAIVCGVITTHNSLKLWELANHIGQ